MIQMKKIILLIIIIVCNSLYAQLSTYNINGYTKYLFSSMEIPFYSERFNDHLLHSRLNTRWYPADNLTLSAELRFRAYYGQSVENILGFREQIKTKHDFVSLDKIIWDEKKSIGHIEFDRLNIDWNIKNLQLTLGRQRIAWGTSWAWNPTDIFNPQSVLDFDYEERPAVDAVRLQYYTGALSKIEFAFKPAKEKENIIAAGLISFNYKNYDINFLSGIKNNRWFAGTGWTGDIYGAGFRGELLVIEGKEVFTYGIFDTPLSSKKPVYSFVISGDYTFPNSFYMRTELLRNSNGTDKFTLLAQEDAGKMGMLTAARWSIYQEFSYDFHPLLRGSVFGIVNPDDHSFIVVPSLSYSVITNLDVMLLCMFFEGKPFTEFGDFGTTIFFRAKFSF